MFEVRGKCVICAQRFVTNNISALRCGHVFHKDCILQWLRCSSTCPTCRAFTINEEIVTHLYFDDPNEHNDSSFLSASPNSQASELLLAEDAMRELRSSLRCKEEEIKELKDYYACARVLAKRKSLENAKLLIEKNRLSGENDLLKVRNKEMEKALETTKRRLQACEFYKMITTRDSEISLDTFMTDDGSLRMQRFLAFQKRQLDEAKNVQNKLREEVREEREQLRASKKKQVELEKYVKNLERELHDLRAVWEKPLKQRLRPNYNATISSGMEKSREGTSGDALSKRKTRRPLVDKTNSSQEANSADIKEKEQGSNHLML